jgi:hypothetical protein
MAEKMLTPFFALTKRYVFSIRQSDETLFAFALPSGPARRIGRIPQLRGLRRFILGLSVSPDDSTIVWAVTNEQQLDLHLVRNFR